MKKTHEWEVEEVKMEMLYAKCPYCHKISEQRDYTDVWDEGTVVTCTYCNKVFLLGMKN